MEDPLKRRQCNVHNGAVHERERRTQDRNQQDGSAIRFRTRMVVGSRSVASGHGIACGVRIAFALFTVLSLNGIVTRKTPKQVPSKIHDHNAELKHSYSYLQALLRFSQAL